MTGRGWSREFVLTVVGTVAGVVGAVAAVLVFVFPSADARTHGADAATQPSGDPPTSAATPADTGSADTRLLAALTPSSGVGAVRVHGRDLAIGCPGNQSDDTYREVRYDLVTPYARIDADVSASGPGDPDATAAVQVFIQRRRERSDRVVEVGRAVVHVGRGQPLAAPVDDAAAVVLRVTCTVPEQTVTLAAPRLTR